MRKRMSKEKIDEILTLRGKGWSYQRLAEKFECSEGAIDYHCLKNGIEPPNGINLWNEPKHLVIKRGNGVVRRFTPEEDEKLLKMNTTTRLKEIGIALERRPSSVLARLCTLARRAEHQLNQQERTA